MPILEKYFGRLPARPQPDEATTTEPPQNSERKVVLKDRSQPLYLEGYHRPDYRSKDDAVFDAITDLMSEGRTSRLYRALVRDKKIASFSAGFTRLCPASNIRTCSRFYAVPFPDTRPQEMADAIHAEIDKLKKEDISDDELKMIKTRSKANLIRGLADNEGLATQLATYQTRYGDWRELFRSVDRIDQVTKADIRRIANEIFVDTNRTVGVIETRAPEARLPVEATQPSDERAPIREVRNEANIFLLMMLMAAAAIFASASSSRGSGRQLGSKFRFLLCPLSSRSSPSALNSKRHGDLPAGRSRTAADRRDRPHPRRLRQRTRQQDRPGGYLRRSLAHRRHQDPNRRSTRRLPRSPRRKS